MSKKQVRNQLKFEFLEFGIADISVIPVRSEPSEKSEMVTQILFGEHFEVTRSNEKWAHIRIAYDGYEGWVDKKMIHPVSKRAFHRISEKPAHVLGEITRKVFSGKSSHTITILAGSTIPFFNGKFSFKIGSEPYKFKGKPVINSHDDRRNLIIKNAKEFLNTPYLWGGRSAFGVDCSGFSQIIYKMNGIFAPRDAQQQVQHGIAVNFVNEAKPGDLAFFDNEEGMITHVGILTGNGTIIHASGKVREDNIDHHGIYNTGAKRYTHKLRVVKDIISYI